MSASGHHDPGEPTDPAAGSTGTPVPSFTSWLATRHTTPMHSAPAAEVPAEHRWAIPEPSAEEPGEEHDEKSGESYYDLSGDRYFDTSGDSSYGKSGDGADDDEPVVGRRSLGWSDEGAQDEDDQNQGDQNDSDPQSGADRAPGVADPAVVHPAEDTGPTGAGYPTVGTALPPVAAHPADLPPVQEVIPDWLTGTREPERIARAAHHSPFARPAGQSPEIPLTPAAGPTRAVDPGTAALVGEFWETEFTDDFEPEVPTALLPVTRADRTEPPAVPAEVTARTHEADAHPSRHGDTADQPVRPTPDEAPAAPEQSESHPIAARTAAILRRGKGGPRAASGRKGRRRGVLATASGVVVAGVIAAALVATPNTTGSSAAPKTGGAPFEPAPITTPTPQPTATEPTSEPTPAQQDAEPTQPPSQPQEMAPIAAVTGIPAPACSADLPWDRNKTSQTDYVAQVSKQWNMELIGSGWTDARNRDVVKLFADTLDAVDCTGYLDKVRAGNGGRLTVSSGPISSWAWGDYGLTRPNTLTLDFDKFREGYAEGDDRGRLVRLIVHEMAHSFNADRFQEPEYWQRNQRLFREVGPISEYGSRDSTETFADAVGYYVARCALDNPYDQKRFQPYYEMVKQYVFDGKEFGGPVGSRQTCN